MDGRGRTDVHLRATLLGRLGGVDLIMETRHPIEIYFGRLSVIIVEFWQPEVARS